MNIREKGRECKKYLRHVANFRDLTTYISLYIDLDCNDQDTETKRHSDTLPKLLK